MNIIFLAGGKRPNGFWKGLEAKRKIIIDEHNFLALCKKAKQVLERVGS